MKEVTLELVCDLDEEELGQRAQSLSLTTLRIDEVEDNKTQANKDFKEELSGLRETTRRLSRALRNKSEVRAVVCMVEFHSPVQGSKRISRKDTGDFVRDEPMSGYEMQSNLFEGEQDVEALAEKVSEAGLGDFVLGVLDAIEGRDLGPDVADALDGMASPVLDGSLESVSLSSGDRTVTIDKTAARRIRSAARAHAASDSVQGVQKEGRDV